MLTRTSVGGGIQFSSVIEDDGCWGINDERVEEGAKYEGVAASSPSNESPEPLLLEFV